MFIELDGHGPHYGQLIRALRAAILAGRLPAGTRLPPSRVLAQELGCSRSTVFAAYEQLRAEGHIYGRVGSGSYVSALPIETGSSRSIHKKAIAPPSRFADRARQLCNWSAPREHRGLRFELQYGSPLVNPGLSAAWGRELAWAATHTTLEYPSIQGLADLREQICAYLARRRGIQTSPDRVLIVSGTQQAIALTAQVLLEEGDIVAIEEPHYCGAWQQLGVHGAHLFPVSTDNEGLVCAELPAQAPRFVLVTPAHQFPSGSVMSLPRRRELLRYTDATSCWIVEDDYDSELRYDSQPLAPLRSLDSSDRVIYIGTLSKVMSGSLRLGYMVLPEVLRDDFVNAKYLSDRGSPSIEQAALAHFMEDGGLERHLRYVTRELRARRKELIEGLQRHAGKRVQIVESHAGMHVVVWLPGYDHAQADALIAHAHERGLGLYSITPHYHERPLIPGLMLGYCALAKAQLRDAMQLFGECLDVIDADVIDATMPDQPLRRSRA
jgi:GntR family transcriptional regulator/MocR family aminotransferase